MALDINGYLDAVRQVRRTGVASEHSYRPALLGLFAAIDPGIDVINEPRRIEVGAPDFIFQRDGVARGWAEHKDIDKDVVKPKGYSKEQKDRYRQALPNLIYTNGLDFEFLRDGKQTAFITIADFLGPDLPARPHEFERLETYLRAFMAETPVTIRSAARLAELMAGKAKLIKDVLGNVLKADPELRSDLAGQFKSFQANLLPNLTPDEFADIYAETVTYGMFAARFHDGSPETFSRQEALELLPKSNPFLRSLFQFVAGYDLDDRIAWIVDDLAEVLRAANVHDLFAEYGKWDARNDPFVHFYEDFLAAYNPAKRKSRGVWYTPEPVVDFIVRAVDDVLKTEFGLADGLADTSKVTINWDTGETHPKSGKPITIKREVHKVQILDPATGTGTFLAKAVQLISDRVKAKAPDHWSAYVERDLLPRLHGFELLMASYAMCHMKLDMQLTQSGYVPSANPPRLSVWLTNALEPAERDIADLFMPAMVKEAKGAAEVKRQTPIMCVIGNPPYAVSSSNTGKWITEKVARYKEDLIEQNVQPLSDDYIKFIRLAQFFVEKNQFGVIGFITNHSYVDGIIHRVMRESLMASFNKIHVLDLQGSALRKEASPNGKSDENVFDIQVGVSIILAVRTTPDFAPAVVTYEELWGSRSAKGTELFTTSLGQGFTPVEVRALPFNFFRPLSKEIESYAERTFSLRDLPLVKSSGVKFRKDPLLVKPHFAPASVRQMIVDVRELDDQALLQKYGFTETADWKLASQRENFRLDDATSIRSVNYRVFDTRYTYYPLDKISRIIPRGDSRQALTAHIIGRKNLSLMTMRQTVTEDYSYALVTDGIPCHGTFYLGNKGQDYAIPLYTYPVEHPDQRNFEERRINFSPKLYAAICAAGGIDPADEAGPEDDFRAATGEARPSEVKVFDYIYGVLHSPDYRRTYAEFLKIDFPRVPYPPSAQVFRHVSEKGEALRRLHLMDPAAIGETPYPFTGQGDDAVASGFPKFFPSPPAGEGGAPAGAEGEGSAARAAAGAADPSPNPLPQGERATGRVLINKDQGFDGVPALAWSFPIGGYMPAQKWLKDRRGRALSYEDLLHYQKIVKILVETDRIMRQIVLPLEP